MKSRDRFIRGWEEGFSAGPARMLAAATVDCSVPANGSTDAGS